MASGSNPSSKRKPSSSSASHKKKPSKKSSEVRKRKRSRSRKRDKLRKRSRRELSVSCSDDDYSRSEDSVSVSFSDSDDDYRRRKGRSQTRVDGKRSKKKSKRSSSVRDDTRDATVRKKRKESKGRDGSEVKKKYRHGKSEKEGSRRGARVDYFSGDSESCSTCRGGSDSEDSYFERSRGRSKGREKDKTRRGRDKDRDRYRSRSCSACSEHNEHSRYQSEERLIDENYSRRLKSVLSVPNEYEEERYQDKNENTEEVILAYDDCPSSKSNDSYDGGRKKETFNEPYTAPETRQEYDGIVEEDRRPDTSCLMDEKVIRNGKKADDAFTFKSKISQSAQLSKGDVGAQYDKTDHVTNMESSKTTKDGEVSTGGVSSVAGDLELILRQKALENFKKFRGAQRTNTIVDDHKNGNDIGVKQLRESEHGPIKFELRRKDDNKAAVAKGVEALGSGSMTRVEGKYVTNSLARGLQIPDDNSKQLDDKVVDTKATQKRIINLGNIRKSNQDSVVNRRESSDDHSVVKPGFPDGKSKDSDTIANKSVQETPKAAAGNFYPRETNKAPGSTSSETKSLVNKIIPEPPKVAVGSSDPSKTDNAHVSAASEATSDLTPATGEHGSTKSGTGEHGSTKSGTGEHGSTESGKAATGDSEFQQKTMSVMRGGEMVQVSYKVYIPKRAPALARRQLRR